MTTGPKISVIIPTLNEEKTIGLTLKSLEGFCHPLEIIVADGMSVDRTREIASENAKVIAAPRGRAAQMNEGARRASGDILLFLHADTQLPAQGIRDVLNAVNAGHAAGRFRMQFDVNDLLLRIFAWYTRFQFFSYGDQCFFVSRALFEKMGGYNEQSPFEDVEFYKRLRMTAHPVILKSCVVTSARRFKAQGSLRQKMINIFLMLRYFSGMDVSADKSRLYQDIR